MRALRLERSRVWVALASAALLAALACALLPGRPTVPALSLAALGAGGVLAQTAAPAARMLWRRRSLLLVVVLAGLVVAWLVVGLTDAGRTWPSVLALPGGTPLPSSGPGSPYGPYRPGFTPFTSWPWRIGRLGRLPLPLLLLAGICACGGFVLVADAVRVQIGLGRPPRSLWRSLTATPTRGGRIAARAIPGVTLIGVAAFLGISLLSRYTAYHPIKEMVGMIGVGACTALLIASPVAVGVSVRLDFDKERHAREQERQRFAAHLHDSVLQTLALIQRQASDPAAVGKLARRQEHALRAWMAGEANLGSATIVGAVRDMLTEVEDEWAIKVELTVVGDSRLDARGEELISAAREALRNAARHAPGAPVNVFLDIGGAGTEMFIRDSGPGFVFDTVPAERRGLRDAVIGRMQFAGGSATVESSPGEGTEVTLRLPRNGRGR